MTDDQPSDLLAQLDAAFEAALTPVPAHLSTEARAAFTWRTVDAELAELLFDSAVDELVGIRGTSTDRRSFRYGAGDVVVRVHLMPDTLVVMVEPPLSVAVRVVTSEATAPESHRTDEVGELAVDPPDLPARLELDLPGGTFVTPWITG